MDGLCGRDRGLSLSLRDVVARALRILDLGSAPAQRAEPLERATELGADHLLDRDVVTRGPGPQALLDQQRVEALRAAS